MREEIKRVTAKRKEDRKEEDLMKEGNMLYRNNEVK
jgi:hypothetical protein